MSSIDGHFVHERILITVERRKSKKQGGGVFALGVTIGGKHKRMTLLHKYIAEAFLGPRPDGFVIDHIDGNVKNNRVVNLRFVSQSHNHINKVRKPDYAIYNWRGTWKVQFKRNKKNIHVGYFSTKERARVARDKKIAELDAAQEAAVPGSGHART